VRRLFSPVLTIVEISENSSAGYFLIAANFKWSFWMQNIMRPVLTIGLSLILALFTNITGPSDLAAQSQQELRVVDATGLTRAISSIDKPATVELHFPDQNQELIRTAKFSLSQADGLSSVIEGEVRSDLTVRFSQVGPGAWRLRIEPSSISPVRIAIIED